MGQGTGTLTQVTVSVVMSGKNNYYIDKASLIDSTYDNSTYVIDRQLISPTVNPYGATNTQGIYIIQCGGKDLVLGRSRIVGTLVFVDPSNKTAIQDSVIWEPAVYNYPALLVSSRHVMNINMDNAGLSESGLCVHDLSFRRCVFGRDLCLT